MVVTFDQENGRSQPIAWLTGLACFCQTIIDGHNRFRICREHGIEFKVVERMFPDREAALDWMDANQLGRRSLTPAQRKLILGRRYNRMKRQGERSDLTSGHFDQKLTTAELLAREHKVSEKTVRRAAKFQSKLRQIRHLSKP